MRTPYAVTLMLAILLAGTYWFSHVEAACSLPLAYRIGNVDERFELSFDEARIALVDAEAVWENATGKNLFRYDEDAEFTINFVFDERQALADAKVTFRERLDESEYVTEEIDEHYAELVAKYNELHLQYEDRVESYERKLNTYNTEVEEYNEAGGAPPEVYEELNARKQALDAEQAAVNNLAARLNDLVAEINRIGEEGNRLVDLHNRQVERYNETFGESREFTQGDYYRDEINIYTFENRQELAVVLAHELGHALTLGHVENESSIMYYLMGGQSEPPEPTGEDLAEFARICSEDRPFAFLAEWKSAALAWANRLGV